MPFRVEYGSAVRAEPDAPRPSDAAHVADGGSVLIVADAVGSRARSVGGAQLVTDALARHVLQLDASTAGATLVRRALEAANHALRAVSPYRDWQPDLAVAAALVLLSPGRVLVGHAGNARLVRLRDGQLTALTRDHTVLEDAHADLSDFEPFASHHRLLSRAVGIAPGLEPSVAEHDALPGDRYLVCTDGLWSAVSDAQLVEALTGARSAEDAAAALRTGAAGSGLGYAFVIAATSWQAGETQ